MLIGYRCVSDAVAYAMRWLRTRLKVENHLRATGSRYAMSVESAVRCKT